MALNDVSLTDPQNIQALVSSANANEESVQDPELDLSETDGSNEINYDSDTWDVVKSYFDINRNYLTKHHIESSPRNLLSSV